MALQGLALRIVFTVTCGVSYLLYGYDQGKSFCFQKNCFQNLFFSFSCMLISHPGFMSGVLLSDDFLRQMGEPSTFMQGFVTSVYTLGCLSG